LKTQDDILDFIHIFVGGVNFFEYSIDYSTSQLPASDKWLYVDVEPACA